MKLKSLISYLNKLAPPHLAYHWDKIGLQVGDKNSSIEKVLVSLDITAEVIQKAIEQNVSAIVSHHPLIFDPLTSIDFSKPQGRMIKFLIEHNIAVFVMHTNLDVAPGGVNDVLAAQHGLDPTLCKCLEVTYKEPLYKLAVYIPEDHLDLVRQSIGDAGAGHIGSYSHCSFAIAGEGTFLGEEGTSPFIGEAGSLEKASERRLETILPASILDSVISEMIKSHPYEEVAYDVYELKQTGPTYGIGRIGKTINGEKLAVCSGSGGKLVQTVSALGAERYICGEAGYHDILEAESLGLKIEVHGHYETENIIVPVIQENLKIQYPELTII